MSRLSAGRLGCPQRYRTPGQTTRKLRSCVCVWKAYPIGPAISARTIAMPTSVRSGRTMNLPPCGSRVARGAGPILPALRAPEKAASADLRRLRQAAQTGQEAPEAAAEAGQPVRRRRRRLAAGEVRAEDEQEQERQIPQHVDAAL